MKDRLHRNERMSTMMQKLSASPNHIFTLSSFCDLFGTAKSTISEDIDSLQDVAKRFQLGEIETVTGAAGGVRYRPRTEKSISLAYIQELAKRLSGSERVLSGGFFYISDILSEPPVVRRMGEILAAEFYGASPDFVLTMETKGIPAALMTANALGVPLVIARRASKVYEGPAVNINYISGSTGMIETMSLSRRAVQEGQRALIIDDFLKGGGTAKGMTDLMREFHVEVVGLGFVMSTAKPEKKCVHGEKTLMILDVPQGETPVASVEPASWLFD